MLFGRDAGSPIWTKTFAGLFRHVRDINRFGVFRPVDNVGLAGRVERGWVDLAVLMFSAGARGNVSGTDRPMVLCRINRRSDGQDSSSRSREATGASRLMNDDAYRCGQWRSDCMR
ncbi:hypothetical protein NL676_036927 [Syzygium grande]|nr:hypothetical protein NL676_036927 [Syzygium grande]